MKRHRQFNRPHQVFFHPFLTFSSWNTKFILNFQINTLKTARLLVIDYLFFLLSAITSYLNSLCSILILAYGSTGIGYLFEVSIKDLICLISSWSCLFSSNNAWFFNSKWYMYCFFLSLASLQDSLFAFLIYFLVLRRKTGDLLSISASCLA